jgi:hypothetical protein
MRSPKADKEVLAVFRALKIDPKEPSQAVPVWQPEWAPEAQTQKFVVVTHLTNGTGRTPKQYAELE